MTRLRNLEISRLEREVVRLVTKLGWTEPLPLYRPAYSTRHFAYEDFINSLLVILGTTEGIETVQQGASRDTEAMCDGKQSSNSKGLLPLLGGSNRRDTEAAFPGERGTGKVLTKT